MAETGMHGTRIDQTGESQLLDATLPLEVGMLDDGKNQRVIDTQEPVIYRVIYDFSFRQDDVLLIFWKLKEVRGS